MIPPQVSVLLPVRDGAATLADAIESLRCQTLSALEIVAVDDGSQDASPQILQRLARWEPRLRVLRQPPAGIVPALQRALAAARAPFWARMDADDLCHPDRLRRQLAWLARHPSCAVVGSRVQTFGARAISEGWRRYERWLNSRCRPQELARDLFVESPLAHPSVMMRREAVEGVGGYRDFDGPEDYDLWLRLAARGAQLAKIPQVLLRWRDHDRRLTRTDARYRAEAFLRLKAEKLAAWPLAGLGGRPFWIWGAGRYGRQLGRALEQQGAWAEAYIDIDPRKIGRQRRGRPVLAPAALRQRPEVAVLAAVPVDGARTLIRRALTRSGRQEGQDYWCCC